MLIFCTSIKAQTRMDNGWKSSNNATAKLGENSIFYRFAGTVTMKFNYYIRDNATGTDTDSSFMYIQWWQFWGSLDGPDMSGICKWHG